MKTWFSQRVQIRLTLSHFSVKAYGLVFHPWKCGCAFLEVWQSYWHVPVPMAQEQRARGGCPSTFLGALGAVALNKIVNFRTCMDKLYRNLTNILKLKEDFQRIISKFGTNWKHHKSHSGPKLRKHLNILATVYLAGSALCSSLISVPCDGVLLYY